MATTPIITPQTIAPDSDLTQSLPPGSNRIISYQTWDLDSAVNMAEGSRRNLPQIQLQIKNHPAYGTRTFITYRQGIDGTTFEPDLLGYGPRQNATPASITYQLTSQLPPELFYSGIKELGKTSSSSPPELMFSEDMFPI